MVRSKKPLLFAPWAPDQPVGGSQGAAEAKGLLWRDNAYRPLPDFAAYGPSSLFAETIVGANGVYDTARAVHIFAGDATRLYKLVNRAPVEVTKPGGYGLARAPSWTFDVFGERVVAVARGIPPQVWEFGVSNAFRNLAGNPPTADTCFTVREWMFLGADRTLTWSAFNNIDSAESWTPSVALQSGITDLKAAGGNIMCGLSGEIGVCFQERAINRIALAGGLTTWQIDQVEEGRGALGPHAACRYGRMFYYASEDGFYAFDGVQSVSIGDGRVDKYFSSRLNYSARDKVSMAVDTQRKALIVSYPSGSSASPNEVMIYSLSGNRWTRDDLALQLVFECPIEGLVPDDAAGVIAQFGTENIDVMPEAVSFDGPEWAETRRQWMAVNTSRVMGAFTGAARAAVADTTEGEIIPGRQGEVTELWPLTDAPPASVTASVVTRRGTLSETPVVGGAAQMNAIGFCPVRQSGRYLKGRVSVAAAAVWTELIGLHWDGEDAGGR